MHSLRRHTPPVEHLPVKRYAVMLFLLTAVMTGIVAFTLTRNAKRSTWQQHSTALTGGARVGASTFGNVKANLRVLASELATSLELQRAVITDDDTQLRQIAAAHHALVRVRLRSIGSLPPEPRISSTATISDGRRVLATVTVGLPLGKEVLSLLRRQVPLPKHAALLLLYKGRIIAGGPAAAHPTIAKGRTTIGNVEFAAQSAPLGLARARIVAVEPQAAIDALSDRYRSFVFLVAAATLALAAGLATRLARPLAGIVGEVAHLSRQAHTDALTGLANRRGLTDRLESALAHAQENGTFVSFVIADVDDFKAINDTHGHQTGDNVLRSVATALAGSVRELDLVARYGGEEFAVVLTGSRLADARRLAERMRRAVHEIEVPSPHGEPARMTMSFGVAEYPTYAGVEPLVAAADAALYQAKRSGKDQVATSTVQARAEAPAEIGLAPTS